MSAKNSAAAKSDITSSSLEGAREVEDENEEEEQPFYIEVPDWIEPNSDEDETESQYSFDKCWELLLSLPSCQHIIIRHDIQKKLQIVAGENLTDEYSWKQVPVKLLRQYLFDEITNGSEVAVLFHEYDPDYQVLVGYAPNLLTMEEFLTIEGDSYVLFATPYDNKMALKIARNIESYQTWLVHRKIYRKARPWISLGSESEVNLTLEKRIKDSMEVEIQAVYPLTQRSRKIFTIRNCTDARDGVIELLPQEDFSNITRKKISIGIQSAPQTVSVEQQTDPTFPTNAWAQYLYEFDDMDLDESDKEEEPPKDEKQAIENGEEEEQEEEIKPPKPPPELSSQVKFLLKVLEFNQVDMYRNDYSLISEEQIENCFTPYLEESISFVSIEKCKYRLISSIAWQGDQFVVAAYAHSTLATIETYPSEVDIISRTVLLPNRVLLWNKADNLECNLELFTPFEVTLLEFCSGNMNILIGGLQNGQMVLWDLTNYINKTTDEEYVNVSQLKYQKMIQQFTKSFINVNNDFIVPPSIITKRDLSHTGALTGIKWLEKNFSIDIFGKIDFCPNNVKNIFITTSLDGSMKFWELNSTIEYPNDTEKYSSSPDLLVQMESPLGQNHLQLIFTLLWTEPLSSVLSDTKFFQNLECPEENETIYNEEEEDSGPKQSILVGTLYGNFQQLEWTGLDADNESKELQIKKSNYAHVHDGPIIVMKENPFLDNIILTISQRIFAIWKKDYRYTPILWRKSANVLNDGCWSEERPAVFFLIRDDGHLEIWDILARDDKACLIQLVTSDSLTKISECGPVNPEKLISIGDEKGNLRLINLPKSFYIPITNESEVLEKHILGEEARKKSIQAWERKYYEKNRDIIDAKMKAEADAQKELERLEKEMELRRRYAKSAKPERSSSLSNLRYTERMKRLRDEANLHRVLDILITRRRIDTDRLENETHLEKERLKYESEKKTSVKRTMKNFNESIAKIRSRILPAETSEASREELVAEMVNGIFAKALSYQQVKTECETKLAAYTDPLFDYHEAFKRGDERRQAISVGMTGKDHRYFWYDDIKKNNELSLSDWGYEQFLNACIEENSKEAMKNSKYTNSAPINIQDGMPIDLI